jgi:hypothetical protein
MYATQAFSAGQAIFIQFYFDHVCGCAAKLFLAEICDEFPVKVNGALTFSRDMLRRRLFQSIKVTRRS